MRRARHRLSRRRFLKTSAAAGAGAAALTIVPRNVLGQGQAPPSEVLRAGLVGCGGQGGEDLRLYISGAGGQFQLVARCDVRFRDKSANHAEAAHRSATILHLANTAIRTGRKIRYDPIKEEVIGDEEANRLVYQPMRAPWRL